MVRFIMSQSDLYEKLAQIEKDIEFLVKSLNNKDAFKMLWNETDSIRIFNWGKKLNSQTEIRHEKFIKKKQSLVKELLKIQNKVKIELETELKKYLK